MSKERWRWVRRYRGYYRVSSKGRVRSVSRTVLVPGGTRQIRGRLLKPSPVSKSGHLFVVLCKDGVPENKLVHRLVLEAFVGPCPEGMECRHFPDRNPANNCLNNIQWGTASQNQRDRVPQGTSNRGEKHYNCKITSVELSLLKRKMRTTKMTNKELSVMSELSVSQISRIRSGVQRAHG